MATHTDTKKLVPYSPRNTPNMPGGEALYLASELQKIGNSMNSIVEVVRLLEARMNTNGLT